MKNLSCFLPSEKARISLKLLIITSIFLQAYFLKRIKPFSRLIPVLKNWKLAYFSSSFRKESLEHP